MTAEGQPELANKTLWTENNRKIRPVEQGTTRPGSVKDQQFA